MWSKKIRNILNCSRFSSSRLNLIKSHLYSITINKVIVLCFGHLDIFSANTNLPQLLQINIYNSGTNILNVVQFFYAPVMYHKYRLHFYYMYRFVVFIMLGLPLHQFSIEFYPCILHPWPSDQISDPGPKIRTGPFIME